MDMTTPPRNSTVMSPLVTIMDMTTPPRNSTVMSPLVTFTNESTTNDTSDSII